LYFYGRGVPRDYIAAEHWYRKAAEQESPYAQYDLGCMYYMGRGVLQDFVLAHMWLNLAAAHSSARQEDFARMREAVAANMTAEQIAEAQRLAREWRSNLAE